MMRYRLSQHSWCFSAGPVFHKAVDIEFGWDKDLGINVGWRFNTRGDHAGFKFWCDLWRVFLSFQVYDHRHWNWEEKRWYRPGEEAEFEGYPHE